MDSALHSFIGLASGRSGVWNTLTASVTSSVASTASNPDGLAPALRHSDDSRVRCYRSQFADVMEMRAPANTVASYLDRHEGWFRRCASPMQVNALEENGYVLTLGRFGNFGFEVDLATFMNLESAIVNFKNANFGDCLHNGNQFVHMLSTVSIHRDITH